MVYYIVSGLLLMFFWCPYMAINVNVQYNGGFLPDIILLTQCHLHRGTCSNAMKWFCICSLLIPPKRFDIFSPITGGCSEGLGVVWFFFKLIYVIRSTVQGRIIRRLDCHTCMELIVDSFVYYEGKWAEVINTMKSAGAAYWRASEDRPKWCDPSIIIVMI